MFNIGDKVRPVGDWHKNEVGTVVPFEEWEHFELFGADETEVAVKFSDEVWLADITELEAAE